MNKIQFKITNKAYLDIEGILDYIAEDNKSAAKKLLKIFFDTFEKLAEFPNLGKVRKDFTYLDVKFYVIKKKYLVVYNIADKNVRILRVLSTYQDVCLKL